LSQAACTEDAAGVHVERRLAAILAADVAGYSRLVGADEEGALRKWRAHWDELIEPKIREHGGRIVRITGDGILSEFASVVNAVRCAVAVQRGMAQRNAGVPIDARFQFRIGVNVGDVIIDRGDVWGEGVNLAARLEALAEPGGICVSGRVHEEVGGKLGVLFEDIGSRQLKNIARPVRVYRARPDLADHPLQLLAPCEAGSIAPSAAGSFDRNRRLQAEGASEASILPARRVARRMLYAGVLTGLAWSVLTAPSWLAMSRSPSAGSAATDFMAPVGATWAASPSTSPSKAQMLSIVVVPFANLSGDAKHDYMADGITDSLTGDLSRALPGSFVVSRGTAFTYKGATVDARHIGRELDVRYVLGGSVLLDGERVRINTQLADTRDGGQLWAERFDTERGSILQVQDEIVGRLSRAVGLKVVDIEAQRSERERPSSAEAIDLIMRGRALLNRPSSPKTMIGARDLFEQALNLEPANVDGLAGVATTLAFEFLNGYYDSGGEARLRAAEWLLNRALTIDPHHLMAMKAKAALLRAQGKFDDAIAAARAVIAENPGEPWAYKEVGLSTMYLGRTEEALDWFAKADRIGPRDPSRWTWLDGRGQALILLGRDQEAIRSLNSALEANPKTVGTNALLAAAYALIGRSEEARAALARYDQARPGTRISTFRTVAPVPLVRTSPEHRRLRQRLEDGLRKAGMPT
jgi:adenylate cyclase